MLEYHDLSGNSDGDRMEALARAKFGDLQQAEIKLIRAAATTRRATLGPNENLWEPLNNPEFSETGNEEKRAPAVGR